MATGTGTIPVLRFTEIGAPVRVGARWRVALYREITTASGISVRILVAEIEATPEDYLRAWIAALAPVPPITVGQLPPH